MTIVLVGKFYTEGFASHISESFVRLGHSIIEFDPSQKRQQAGSKLEFRIKQIKGQFYNLYQQTPLYFKRTEDKIRKLVGENKVDLVISCHDFLTPGMVSAFKANGKIPVAMWFPDHLGVFGKSMFLNAGYDFLFFKDPYIVSILESDLNMKSWYLPECCNPIHHKKVSLSKEDHLKYDCDITTAGNMHPNRLALFSQLTEFDCKIWGNPPAHWMNVNTIKNMLQYEFVANEEKSKAFSAAKIVINNLQQGEIIGVNVRTFEIAACGGFQLMNYRPGLRQLYSEDEVIAFNSVPELKDLVSHYLQNPQERFEIAERAYIKTINQHTYQKRIELLLNTINGNSEGYELDPYIIAKQ